jgi:hypothetical protein
MRELYEKWQQLKIQIETAGDGRLRIAQVSIGVVKEFVGLIGDSEPLTLDHVDWLGWELVTVCKNNRYYKRPLIED